MATIVLSAVGGALFGPIGAIAGTVLGAAVDREIIGSLAGGGRREGPRLASLAVQSSAYGEPVPRLYGRMRVAGNVVWTSGIRETSSRSGGGKRGPRTTTYSYSASFAVMLGGRPIAGIGRVWADGALLRDASGVWASPVAMRVHRGDERQAADPLIAAAEGGAAPAYRGRAYAVFEDLPLDDYGNRIPNLTFEVIADAAGLGLATVAADLVDALATVAPAGFPTLDGFVAARAGSVRAQLESVATLCDLAVADDGAVLRLSAMADAAVLALPADLLGATADASPSAAREERRAATASVADALAVGFQDPGRDFQAGSQRAVRRTPVGREERADLPAALAPEAAKAVAAAALARGAARRRTAAVRLPWRYAGLRPGARVRLGATGAAWRVRRRTIEGAVVALEVEALPGAATGLGAADGGRAVAHPAQAAGPTTFHVLDLPPLPGALATTPRLWVAAAGASAGWRGATVSVSGDGGESYAVAGRADVAAVLGTTLTTLAGGSPGLWDDAGSLDVELLAPAMTLESRSATAVLAGANLALVGEELVQFAEAVMLGARRYRLRRLLRGRRGTEAAIAGHVAGERFVLLDAETLLAIDPPLEAVGATLRLRAEGAGDPPGAPPLVLTLNGRALRPLPPAHLRVTRDALGLTARWTRRSRTGWGWSDGVDAPLGEAAERYRVNAALDGVAVREAVVETPEWRWAATDFAAAGGGAASVATISISQLGAIGDGGVATTTLSLD